MFKSKCFLSLALVMLSLFASGSAQAADGCKYLLCIVGPWNSIGECIPTVNEVHRDISRGKPFPRCEQAGAGNDAGNEVLTEATCPSMYKSYDGEGGYGGCSYSYRVNAYIEGELWSQVYWNEGGGTATFYTDRARAALTQNVAAGAAPLEENFNRDLASWNEANVGNCNARGGTSSYDGYNAFSRCVMPSWD